MIALELGCGGGLDLGFLRGIMVVVVGGGLAWIGNEVENKVGSKAGSLRLI